MEASDSSVHGSEERGNKRLKLQEEEEDRISDLPDSLIHHILSFLPSTREAIWTSILSKRWQNQWARVPVLIFEQFGTCPYPKQAQCDDDFTKFIDNTLHLYICSKINKFHIAYNLQRDTNLTSKLRFAARKYVEELILDYNHTHDTMGPLYMLPKFLFDNDSLVKLQIQGCDFQPSWRVNWASLKVLKIDGRSLRRDPRSIENVLSGSPSLEYLEIKDLNSGWKSLVNFSSTSLKILILLDIIIMCDIAISCPNLEELYVKRIDADDPVCLPDKAIKDFVSGSPLLHTLEIEDCLFEELVIASKSLKKLVVGGIDGGAIEISCPNVEDLELYGLANDPFKVMNFKSLICATLSRCGEHVAKLILEQLRNVRELSVGRCFIEVLSDVEMEGVCVSYPWPNNKILTLHGPDFEHLPGIMCALRSSSMLERLVIKLEVHEDEMTSHAFGENYWNSNGTVVNCLVSHLKIVEIIGLSKLDAKREVVLNFIKFLLKNAKVLEKLVLVISKDGGTSFAFEVSQMVSSFPRCSPHAIVELSCSK